MPGREDRDRGVGAGERVDAALHHAVAAPHEHEVGARRRRASRARFGAFLLFGTSYQSGSVTRRAPRGTRGARRARRRATSRECAMTATVVMRSAPSRRASAGARPATAVRTTNSDASERERAEQDARRHVGGEVHAAVQPRDDHERGCGDRDDPGNRARDRIAHARRHDQREADVRARARRRCAPTGSSRSAARRRACAPRAGPGRRACVVVRNTVTSSTSAVTRNAIARQRRRQAEDRDDDRGDADHRHRFRDVRSDAREVVRGRVAMIGEPAVHADVPSGRVVGEQHARQRPAQREQQRRVSTTYDATATMAPAATGERSESRAAACSAGPSGRGSNSASERPDEGGGSVRARGEAEAPVAAPVPVDGFVITLRVFTASAPGKHVHRGAARLDRRLADVWRARDVRDPSRSGTRSGLTACDGCGRPSRVAVESRRARVRTRARRSRPSQPGCCSRWESRSSSSAAFAVGVLFWMVRANAGLERLDRGFATWGGAHATDLATSVLRAITQLGSTMVVVIVGGRRRARRVPAHAVAARCRFFLVLVDRRPERHRQPGEGARRSGPTRHPPARGLLRRVVPERALGRRGRDLCGVRAADRTITLAVGRRRCSAASLSRSRSRSRARACCSACTGSRTCSRASRSAGRGSRSARSRSVAGCCASVRRWRPPNASTSSTAIGADAFRLNSERAAGRKPTARTLETTRSRLISQTTRTFWASSPLRPGATSNSTA